MYSDIPLHLNPRTDAYGTVSISELHICVKRICGHTNCGDASATVVFNTEIIILVNVVAHRKDRQAKIYICVSCVGLYTINMTKTI